MIDLDLLVVMQRRLMARYSMNLYNLAIKRRVYFRGFIGISLGCIRSGVEPHYAATVWGNM